jgi:hypothetical protein
MQTPNVATRLALYLIGIVLLGSSWGSRAAAQVPVPTASTPTLQGATPLNGMAAGGQIGYAALRGDFFYGKGKWDLNVSAGIPTFGNDNLPGYNQSLGLDVRVPFRIHLLESGIMSGSIKVGPQFNVGRACYGNNDCGVRAVGTGVQVGWMMDFALPKIFKIIGGIEQQMGMINWKGDVGDGNTEFYGATWFDIGLDAFWRESIFFTLIMNVGLQYGSNELYRNDRALFRQMFGAGYKFK